MHKKISYLGILLRSIAYAMIHGTAKMPPKSPRVVLVFQLAQLGDMVCTTPVFRAIKSSYPESRLCVVGQPQYRELLNDNQDVDEYIAFTEFEEVLARVAPLSIDVAISVAPSFTALAIAFLGGAKAIIAPRIENGFSPNSTWMYGLLRAVTITRPHRMGSYAPGEYLRLLEPLGITTNDTRKHLGFSLAAKGEIQQLFNVHGIQEADTVVGISVSSGNKIKNWGADRFARVADYIYTHYKARIMLIGGPADAEEVIAFKGAISGDTPIIDASHALSLDALKALIARMHIFISVDTGPIYIAEAFGVKTIDIVGPVDEREQPPQGIGHLVVKWKERTKPAVHIMNARIYNYDEARRQVERISVEDVCQAFDMLMK